MTSPIDLTGLRRAIAAVGVHAWRADGPSIEYPEAPGLPVLVIDPEGIYPEQINAAVAAYIAAVNPAVMDHLVNKVLAPDLDTRLRRVVSWLADEIGAAERGKATTRAARKAHAKNEAVNRLMAVLS